MCEEETQNGQSSQSFFHLDETPNFTVSLMNPGEGTRGTYLPPLARTFYPCAQLSVASHARVSVR